MLFSVVAFVLLSIESFYSYFTKAYESDVNGSEVYLSVHKSKVKKKVKILIIGDSVGEQLYNNETYNDDIYSLTCNQAVSMAGQYILLYNFIENNPESLPHTVLIIMSPVSFTNNLDQVFSFHYFLKPFYKKEYENQLTDTCLTQIHKIPLYFLSQMPFVLNTNWSPTYSPATDTTYKFISPVSCNYLLKIKELCSVKHILLRICCPPVKKSNRELNLRYATSVAEIRETGLEKEFGVYFNDIVFWPDSLYRDHIHFKKQYIPKDYYHLTGH